MDVLCDKMKRMSEYLDPETVARVQKELASPDIRMQTFDVTVEGWLARIDLWGKVKYVHEDPENKFKGEISKTQFISKIKDTSLNKLFGEFKTEVTAINKLVLSREYVGLDFKKHTEKFIISVELKKELKKAVSFPNWLFAR